MLLYFCMFQNGRPSNDSQVSTAEAHQRDDPLVNKYSFWSALTRVSLAQYLLSQKSMPIHLDAKLNICFTCYIRPNFVLWKYTTTVIINTTSKSSVKHIFCTVTLLCSIISSCIHASYFYALCHLHWAQVGIMYWPIIMITSLLEWVNK